MFAAVGCLTSLQGNRKLTAGALAGRSQVTPGRSQVAPRRYEVPLTSLSGPRSVLEGPSSDRVVLA